MNGYRKRIEETQINPPAPAGYRRRRVIARPPMLQFTPPEELNLPPLPEFPSEEPEEAGLSPARVIATGLEKIAVPFNWINEHIEKPWAALLLLAKARVTPGEQAIEQALANRLPTDSYWDTIKTSYEQTELKGWQKFLMEFSMPLWWIFPQGAITKAVGLGTKGLKAIGVTGAVSKALTKTPVIRSMLKESVISKSWNAPARMGDLFFDMEGAYSRVNLSGARLVRDISRGRLEPEIATRITNASVAKSGAKKLEVLEKLLNDDVYRGVVNKELPAMAEQVEKGLIKMEDVHTYLGGDLRRHLAAEAGKKVPAVPGGLLNDAYAFWRAGVLTTPWYVMQNYFEDFFRTMVGTFEPFRFAGFEITIPLFSSPSIAGTAEYSA